jgi:small GTP-binding protein
MKQLTTKICLLGDFSVGKTSLVRRFVESRFDESYISTIGVRVSRKTLNLAVPDPTTLTLLIWDTAGSEPFNTIVRTYYQGSSAALLVCDLTRSETLVSLGTYIHEFQSINPGVPFVIIGNKTDLVGQRTIPDELIHATATTYGAPWFLGSAKTGDGVEQAFQALGIEIYNQRSGM